MFLDIRTAMYKHIHLCRGLSTVKSVALAQTPVHRVHVKISVRPSFRGCGEDDEPTRCIYDYAILYYTLLVIIIKSCITYYLLYQRWRSLDENNDCFYYVLYRLCAVDTCDMDTKFDKVNCVQYYSNIEKIETS